MKNIKNFLFLMAFLATSFAIGQSYERVLKDIEKSKERVLQQMSENKDKEKNDVLFDTFYNQSIEKLGTLDGVYINKNVLEKNGLESFEEEGFSYIVFKKDYIYKNFRNYLSEEYLTYIGIMNKQVYSDATVVISWRDFARYIYFESEFIKKYPNSKRINDVKQKYAYDLYAFLMGTDNSRVTKEASQVIKDFPEDYPNTPATEIVKHYLDKQRMPKDNLVNSLQKEIKKQIGYSPF